MNQPYKKHLKPYLLIGGVSGFLVYWVTNWIYLSSSIANMTFYERVEYFFTVRGLTLFLSQSLAYLFKYNIYFDSSLFITFSVHF